MNLVDLIDDGKGQAILISHHPELINQCAPSHGVQWTRPNATPPPHCVPSLGAAIPEIRRIEFDQ